MRHDLEESYLPSCEVCQQNKATTKWPPSPLHLLPVPDNHGDSIAIDFVGPLSEDKRFNYLITITDHLGADIRLIPTHTLIMAPELVDLLFNYWYCENRLLLEIISDRDKLFLSRFWKAIHKHMGVKIRMSTVYHPEMDGASE